MPSSRKPVAAKPMPATASIVQARMQSAQESTEESTHSPPLYERAFSVRAERLIKHILQKNCIDLDRQVDDLLALAADATTVAELQLTLKIAERIPTIDSHEGFEAIAEAMSCCKSIEVFFINDNGPYAGAGIAVSRQAIAFARNGHQCTIVALNHHSPEVIESMGRFQEHCEHNNLSINLRIPEAGQSTDQLGRDDHSDLIAELVTSAKRPSLVILGNLHSTPISCRFIYKLVSLRVPIILYAHDLDFVSGGCAYPQYYECDYYLHGCRDSRCPKPHHNYPMSSAGLIEQQYIERSLISKLPGIRFFANSHWTASAFQHRFSTACAVVRLGVDTKIFSPNSEVRKQLRADIGVGEETLLVAVGADSLSRTGKGGDVVVETIRAFKDNQDIQFLSFGHNNLEEENVVNMGYTSKENEVASVFQSADLFLNTATIEAFGQTAIEAAACGCPTICLAGSGLEDAVQHGISGVALKSQEGINAVLLSFSQNRQLLHAFKLLSIEWAQQNVSLERVYINWLQSLLAFCN